MKSIRLLIRIHIRGCLETMKQEVQAIDIERNVHYDR